MALTIVSITKNPQTNKNEVVCKMTNDALIFLKDLMRWDGVVTFNQDKAELKQEIANDLFSMWQQANPS